MRLKFEPTIPNILTLLRLAAIPVMAWFILAGQEFLLESFIMFILIWVTDLLDGLIARKFNQMTDFGKLFDPLVDKIFQLTLAVVMTVTGRLPWWIPVIIAVKEVMMVAGSAVLFSRRKMVVYARWYGKVSTVLFVLAFASLFWLPAEPEYLPGLIFLPPLLWTAYAYIRYGISYLRIIHNDETVNLESKINDR
jgi:CDP-diacylglycerol--glycerol-3-phosphate 3-phosphatidyltransferase